MLTDGVHCTRRHVLSYSTICTSGSPWLQTPTQNTEIKGSRPSTVNKWNLAKRTSLLHIEHGNYGASISSFAMYENVGINRFTKFTEKTILHGTYIRASRSPSQIHCHHPYFWCLDNQHMYIHHQFITCKWVLFWRTSYQPLGFVSWYSTGFRNNK